MDGKTKALMVPGTKQLSWLGHLIVTVECSGCGMQQQVGYKGWTALYCRPLIGGCGAEMQRTAEKSLEAGKG